jgi:hypothetical protein
VAGGVAPARATVRDIILKDNAAENGDLRSFVQAVEKGVALPQGHAATAVRPLCAALIARLNTLVTSRDASLVYWAFLMTHGAEIRRYGDGKSCADPALTADLTKVGLALGPEWAP